MRLDRQITLKIAAPLLKLRKSRRPGIPILMYHSISEPKSNHRHPYFETCTSPKIFAQHMKYLHDNNYQVISLTEAVQVLQHFKELNESPNSVFRRLSSVFRPLSSGSMLPAPCSMLSNSDSWLLTPDSSLPSSALCPLPSENCPPSSVLCLLKPVVLTFDDGFRDFYTAAGPVLKQYDFTATVFLPTAYITEKGATFKGIRCLTWSEVRELNQAGFSFGSHTVTHPELYSLDRQAIEQEMKASKETIENNLGEPIKSFSYPYAFPEHDRNFSGFIHETLAAGCYSIGVSTRLGTATAKDNLFALKRIPVNDQDDLKLLQAKLSGDYDWLYWPQAAKKSLKSLLSHLRVLHAFRGKSVLQE